MLTRIPASTVSGKRRYTKLLSAAFENRARTVPPFVVIGITEKSQPTGTFPNPCATAISLLAVVGVVNWIRFRPQFPSSCVPVSVGSADVMFVKISCSSVSSFRASATRLKRSRSSSKVTLVGTGMPRFRGNCLVPVDGHHPFVTAFRITCSPEPHSYNTGNNPKNLAHLI
jgi:hypothetical protein